MYTSNFLSDQQNHFSESAPQDLVSSGASPSLFYVAKYQGAPVKKSDFKEENCSDYIGELHIFLSCFWFQYLTITKLP